MLRRPPRSTLFPTRRSSDLSTVDERVAKIQLQRVAQPLEVLDRDRFVEPELIAQALPCRRGDTWIVEEGLRSAGGGAHQAVAEDRKSTRLNSSHGYISYAVF